MASNKNRYTSSRLKHIFSSLPYAFLSLFTKRDKKLIVFSAMHCETFDSNSKFLFLHFLKNEPEYTVKFVINDDEKRNALEKEYGPYFIDTRTKEGKLVAVKAGVWVVSWLDLPIGGFFLKPRRLIIHLGHGTPLKNIGLCEKDGGFVKKVYYKLHKTNISYSLGSTPFVAKIIEKCLGFPEKRVLVYGQPRTDALFAEPLKVEALNNGKFNVLYAPTWRQYSVLKLFPFENLDTKKLEEFLVENNIHLWIRFHPAYEQSIPKEFLELQNISLFSASVYPEVMDYINCFDSLITDYSSIYLDYMLLERPIMFLPYDLEEYERLIGFTMDYMENTPGPKPETQEEFQQALLKFKSSPEEYIDLVKKANEKLNSNSKNNCQQLADFIKSKGKK